MFLTKLTNLKMQKWKGTNLLSTDVHIAFLELRGTKILIGGWIPCSSCRIMIVTSCRGAIYTIGTWHYKVSWVCCICTRFELWKRIFHSGGSNSWGWGIYSAGLWLLRKCTITHKLMDCWRWDIKWWKIGTIRNVVRRVMGYMHPTRSEDRDRLLSNSYWALHQPSSLSHKWCWTCGGQDTSLQINIKWLKFIKNFVHQSNGQNYIKCFRI